MIEYPLGSRQEYPLTEEGERAQVLASNCADKRREIEERFDVAKIGSCDHPTPADADAYALSTLVPLVIADGGVINTEAGHRTVKNTSGPVSWHTYLSYAAGDHA